MTLRFKFASFIYSLVCDIPVSFFLCLASAITAQSNLDSGILTINFSAIDWTNFGINFVISLTLALLISNFIPLTRIGRWAAKVCHVPNETYSGNVKYRLIATLSSTIIFFIIISPTLTLFNCIFYPLIIGADILGWKQIIFNFFVNMPILLIVGFVSSLINDIGAYKAAHHIDNSF